MDKPIIDLEELLEEAQDRIEEKIAMSQVQIWRKKRTAIGTISNVGTIFELMNTTL